MALAIRFRLVIKHPGGGTLLRTETFSFNGSQPQQIALEAAFDAMVAAAQAVGTGMVPHIDVHGFSGWLDDITDNERCAALANKLLDIASVRKLSGLEALHRGGVQ